MHGRDCGGVEVKVSGGGGGLVRGGCQRVNYT